MWIKLSNLWFNVFLAYSLGSDKYANFLIFCGWLLCLCDLWFSMFFAYALGSDMRTKLVKKNETEKCVVPFGFGFEFFTL
jgi:hypothetical protein